MKHGIIVFVLGAACGAFAFHYFTSSEGQAQTKSAVKQAATSAHAAIDNAAK